MKKYFMFAAIAAAGLFASCSSDDNIASENAQGIVDNDSERVPIQLGIAATASADITRGIGTVGGVAVGDNIWKGQKVNIFMFNQGTLKLTKTLDPDDITNYPTPIYNNTVMTTPDETGELTNLGTGVAQEVLDDGRVKLRYYPIEGTAAERKSDFWGYFVDDAGTGANGVGVPTDTEDTDANVTQIKVPFVIDGSQDLMVAKTVELTATQLDALDATDATKRANYFSAYSARRDIQPELSFAHQLTRLTFEFEGGTKTTVGWNWNPAANAGAGAWENSASAGNKFTGVFVKSVKVTSNTKGDMIVAYKGTPAPTDLIVWDTTDPLEAKLSLKSAEIDATTAEVPATYWDTQAAVDAHNNGLADALKVATPLSNLADAAAVAAANAKLKGAISTATELTAAQATTLNGIAGVSKTTYAAGENPTDADAILYNATLTGAILATGEVAAADAETYNANLVGAVALNDEKTPAIPAHQGTDKLKALYEPAADFPDINPANYSNDAAGLRTAWGKWGDALEFGSQYYDDVYKLTGTVTAPGTQASAFTANDVTVGGALLVEPRASYTVEVELGQYLKDKDANGTANPDEYYVRYMPVSFTVDAGAGNTFEKGNSYKVHVKVYGSEDIRVTTTLQAWGAGADQDIDTEDFGY